jgi:tetratricopeptide (TPR) repeat protein
VASVWRGLAIATVAGGLLAGCPGGPSDEDVSRSRAEYELGVGLYGESNIAGAFQHLQEAIRLDPENVEAHMVLGTLHALRGENELAERHLRTTIDTNERLGPAGLPALTPDAFNTLGVLYINTHRLDDAVTALRTSTGDLMNRTPHLAWGNLGWAYYEMHQFPEALDALGQAVRLQPQFCGAWYRIGQVRFAQAQQLAEAGPAGEPGGDAQSLLAQADEALTHALEVDRDECRALQDAWLLRGETRARLGRREEAIADFERCVELDANTEAGRACAGLLSTGS